MKQKLKSIYSDLRPFRDIIWFLLLFIVLDFLWKLMVDYGENNDQLIVFGKNMTDYAEPICRWTAQVSHWIIHTLFGYKDLIIDNTLLYFNHPVAVKDILFPVSLKLRIVWECTGIQQMVLFLIIMLIYPGPARKKLWFIPLSLFILNFINIIRIVASALLIKDGVPDWFISFNEWYNKTEWVSNNPDVAFNFYVNWFDMFHGDIFKWLYYNGVIFLLWLIWQEKYNLPYQKEKLSSKK